MSGSIVLILPGTNDIIPPLPPKNIRPSSFFQTADDCVSPSKPSCKS